jgi:hypothetical protein
MKPFKLLLPLLLALTIAVSCKKEVDAPIDLSNSIWQDSAIINGIIYKPFKIAFNFNGTAAITIGSFNPFTGSWNKTPNSTTVYFFFDESSTIKWKGEGTLNVDENVITGTITRTAPSTLTGTFNAKKQ